MFKPSVRSRGMSSVAARQQARPKARAERAEITKSASINIDGRDQTVSCTIRDLSATGARISVANSASINNRFLLLCRSSDMIALADIVWRSSHEIGVHFMRRGSFHQEAEFRTKQAEVYQNQLEAAGRAQAEPQSAFIAQQAAISMQAHYETMGLDPSLDYTPEQLKHKFRILALRAHPDHGGDAETFQKLQSAFNTLTAQAGVPA